MRGTRTDHSLEDKIEETRALPQRTSAMCTEFPSGEKAGRRHPSDRGCRLGWRPKDKVLHVWWSVGNRSALHSRHWFVTQAKVSLSSAESEAKTITKGCIEALYVKTCWNTRLHDRLKLNSGRTAAAPKPLCDGLDQGAERNTWRCRRCGFNS